jgi:hypothetical protein
MFHPLRPPEIEKELFGTRWRSRWALRLSVSADQRQLSALAKRISASQPPITAELHRLSSDTVRLDLGLPMHPLNAEAYPLIDEVLMAIDEALSIAMINDAIRAWWRTFRWRQPFTSGRSDAAMITVSRYRRLVWRGDEPVS